MTFFLQDKINFNLSSLSKHNKIIIKVQFFILSKICYKYDIYELIYLGIDLLKSLSLRIKSDCVVFLGVFQLITMKI